MVGTTEDGKHIMWVCQRAHMQVRACAQVNEVNLGAALVQSLAAVSKVILARGFIRPCFNDGGKQVT